MDYGSYYTIRWRCREGMFIEKVGEFERGIQVVGEDNPLYSRILFSVSTKEGSIVFLVDYGRFFDSTDEYTLKSSELGVHAVEPRWEADEPTRTRCDYTNDSPCYFNKIGNDAEELFNALEHKGIMHLWKTLEEYHKEWFSKPVVTQVNKITFVDFSPDRYQALDYNDFVIGEVIKQEEKYGFVPYSNFISQKQLSKIYDFILEKNDWEE